MTKLTNKTIGTPKQPNDAKAFSTYRTGHAYKGVNISGAEHPKEVRELLLQAGKGTIGETLHLLRTAPTGITQEEAARRLKLYGRNEVAREKPPAWWSQLIKSFITPFTLILLALAVTSLFTDVILATSQSRTWSKIIIILSIVTLSGGLRFW